MPGRISGLHHGLGVTPDMDAHTRNVWQMMRTGEYYFSPHVTSRSATATALDAADRLYVTPFLVTRDITVDRIACHVTVQAGQKIRMGIYNDGTNLAPGTLLLDAGEITLSGVGVQAITISQSLKKGLYWVGIVSDGTPTLKDYNTYCWGVIGVVATDFATFYSCWYIAHTYGALPDPFGSGTKDYRYYGVALRLLSLD